MLKYRYRTKQCVKWFCIKPRCCQYKITEHKNEEQEHASESVCTSCSPCYIHHMPLVKREHDDRAYTCLLTVRVTEHKMSNPPIHLFTIQCNVISDKALTQELTCLLRCTLDDTIHNQREYIYISLCIAIIVGTIVICGLWEFESMAIE